MCLFTQILPRQILTRRQISEANFASESTHIPFCRCVSVCVCDLWHRQSISTNKVYKHSILTKYTNKQCIHTNKVYIQTKYTDKGYMNNVCKYTYKQSVHTNNVNIQIKYTNKVYTYKFVSQSHKHISVLKCCIWFMSIVRLQLISPPSQPGYVL